MNRWFRFYDDVINDPKVLKLPEVLRWHWVAVLCIASKYSGAIPGIDDVALLLRTPKHKAAAILTQLHAVELLDKTETGFTPHNWNVRQYKSDVSTERVKRFRKRERNVSETPSESDTETDTERVLSGGVEKVESEKRLPRHGATSRARGTIFVCKGTSEWDAYASDYKAATGSEAIADRPADGGGIGKWFPIVGSMTLPTPQRLARVTN